MNSDQIDKDQPINHKAAVRQQDGLSWNYIRVMKEREGNASNPSGAELFNMVSDPEIEDSQNNHPIVWSCVYLISLAILTHRNMYNFFAFSDSQAKMVGLLLRAPGSNLKIQ